MLSNAVCLVNIVKSSTAMGLSDKALWHLFINIMRYIYLISLVILFNFCQEKSRLDDQLVISHLIDPTQGEKISLSQIIESIEVIQPNEMEIVAHVSNYIFYEEKLIIIDNYKQKKVQVFDTQGNHLFEIKASGVGPGQFKTPNLVRINQVGNRILVYCSLTKKILQFDMKGNYIEETLINEIGLIGDFIERDKEIIFLNVMTIEADKRIGKLNLETYPKDKNISYFTNYPGQYIKVLSSKSQFFFGTHGSENFYFLDLYSSNIVKMDWNGNYSIQQFKFNKNQLELNPEKIHNPVDIIDQLHISEPFHIGSHLNISQSNLLIPIEKGMNAYGTIVFNTEKNTIKIISTFEDGLEKILPNQALSAPGDIYSQTAIINIDPDHAYEKIKSMNLEQNEFTKKLKKLNTPNNQNPVFIIYFLK